jgi:hypothetical protein
VVWGHVERLERDIRMLIWGAGQLNRERSVASARAALGDDGAFNAARRRGHAMTTAQAIEFVLDPDAA